MNETQYPNAVTRFFNKVLGIRKKPKGRTFVKIDVTYVEMEIINNNQVSSKSINYINELTDITVAVWAKRKCRNMSVWHLMSNEGKLRGTTQ